VSYLIMLSMTGTEMPRERVPDSLRRAKEIFRQFHCFPSHQTIRLPQERVIPAVLAHVGELRGLIYCSDRGQRGKPRTFVHFFKLRPQLTCDARGKQLYILGGNYRVTTRGLEG
jgi:phosphopantetheinyl transferase